jgi:hypothetical protein
MKYIRTFEQYKVEDTEIVNEKKTNKIESECKPGDVYKYKWTSNHLVYYMILSDKYKTEDGEMMYLTTNLVSIKDGKVLVPYNKKSIYYTKDEKQGSQRSGYWKVGIDTEFQKDLILSPIDEKDIEKLIKLFSKNPRQLDYLKEIKDEEGIVPKFLKSLL